nr:RNA-binding protein pno1-like [Quercus suber]
MQSKEAPTSMDVEAVPSEPKAEFGSLPMKPKFKPLSAHEMSDGQVQFRKVNVPPHRFSPLKKAWMEIYTPVYEQMKIDIRMNLKARRVELKTRTDTPDISNLQKCADFVHAFMLGFDVIDAIALLRLDELYVESFEIKDVKTLRGEHLSRAIGRLSGKGGKTKFAIENATNAQNPSSLSSSSEPPSLCSQCTNTNRGGRSGWKLAQAQNAVQRSPYFHGC